MMKRELGIFAAVAAGLMAGAPAAAQTAAPGGSADTTASLGRIGDMNFFAGVRVWANEWDIVTLRRELAPDPANPTSLIARDQLDITTSDLELTPMPTIGVRYGKLLASVTYFMPTSYNGKGGLEKDVERREIDLNIGYYILPSLVVSLGYKDAKVDRILDTVDSEQKIKGILLGLSGSAPLSERWSLYGNFAYGLGRQKSEFSDATGESKYSARYAIGELGLSYRIMDGNSGAFIKSLSGSIGYRAQSYTTKDVGLGTYALSDPTTPISTTTRDGRTTTSGAVFALVASF